jgi:hypothetical protein
MALFKYYQLILIWIWNYSTRTLKAAYRNYKKFSKCHAYIHAISISLPFSLSVSLYVFQCIIWTSGGSFWVYCKIYLVCLKFRQFQKPVSYARCLGNCQGEYSAYNIWNIFLVENWPSMPISLLIFWISVMCVIVALRYLLQNIQHILSELCFILKRGNVSYH